MPAGKLAKLARHREADAMLKRLLLGVLCCSPVSSLAQSVDTQRPQGEMLMRIERAIDGYAADLSVGSTVVAYCRVQMQLDTRHAADGSIPFGVNYRSITSEQQLRNVLWVREAYEITYLKLCIARAKRDLDAVERSKDR